MKKIKFTVLMLNVIVFGLVSTPLLAQDPDFPIGDDPGNAPAAPIDQWVIPMLLLMTTLVFVYFRKQIKHKIK
ncbi:MAG: hypothetical protein NWQ14_07775 [Flavobacterium sp.]|jgi:hypothetical protein|nr:hypothetical protein [Flavobacterium sp.]